MSSVVRFSPDLSSWLVGNLNQGRSAESLVQIMIDEQMDPHVAHSIVAAFVRARAHGEPVPVDSVSIQDPLEFAYEAPILEPSARILVGDRTIRVLSRTEQPALAVLGDVLSAQECGEVIALARPRLTPSTIVNPSTGQNVVAAQRTSLGMFFRLEENPLIARLDRRISELMRLPLENGEGFQVLCYPLGAETKAHFDFLQPSNQANRASIARSGQRVSTLIAYLNDVDQGGETVFPKLGLTVLPQRGNAVYFEYCNSQNQVDPHSLHSGNPVLRGEKWVLTKWMRQRRFVSAGAASSDGMLD
ncbi:MAG: 2OG-Fe(II) oxygenase [Polyangiaceae bacterium]